MVFAVREEGWRSGGPLAVFAALVKGGICQGLWPDLCFDSTDRLPLGCWGVYPMGFVSLMPLGTAQMKPKEKGLLGSSCIGRSSEGDWYLGCLDTVSLATSSFLWAGIMSSRLCLLVASWPPAAPRIRPASMATGRRTPCSAPSAPAQVLGLLITESAWSNMDLILILNQPL